MENLGIQTRWPDGDPGDLGDLGDPGDRAGLGDPAGPAVVSVTGELDVATGPALRGHLLGLIHAGARTVVLDLSGVPFLDSSGLSTLVIALKRLRTDGGTLRLAGCVPAVQRLLAITALDAVLATHPTVEDALAADGRCPEPVAAAHG